MSVITDYRAVITVSQPCTKFTKESLFSVQWGMPVVMLSAVLGLMAGVVSSAVESVGDYYACARMAGAPQPPSHAINRAVSGPNWIYPKPKLKHSCRVNQYPMDNLLLSGGLSCSLFGSVNALESWIGV